MKNSRLDPPIRLSEFALAVIDLCKKVPRGRVATYSQIARLAGKPHGSRGVGWILRSCSKKYKIPWQRVINSQGKISFKADSKEFRLQKKLLEAEGVNFSSDRGLDLRKYQWKKQAREEALSPRTPRMFR